MAAIGERSGVSMNPRWARAPRNESARWQALLQRDRNARGAFVYAVLSTGVYCSPGCASRRPRRENVRFFDTGDEAERAGFRPCKRCAPNAAEGANAHRASILHACELIDASETPPSLSSLAATAGLSPFHFQRVFKQTIGVTPKQYAMEKRRERVRAHLLEDTTVTEAAFHAGFGSGSRFYDESSATLGMKPSDYRAGAAGIVIRHAIALSYLGWVLVATTDLGICAISLGDSRAALRDRLRAQFPQAELHDDPALSGVLVRVLAFLESPHCGLDLPLDIRGTAFQRRVWRALQEIPAGETASYAEIAARLGEPRAARAVARACAANALAVAIPCHRVIRKNGDPGGYRWGLPLKRALLEREKRSP